MIALEWIVLIELLALAVAAIMGLVGMFIARQDPEDPVHTFCATFWREFLWPPTVMEIDSEPARRPAPARAGGVKAKPTAAKPGGKSAAVPEASEEDAFYGRLRKGDDGRTLKSSLDILVEPNAPSDEVVGREAGGIRLRVIGEAGESRSNKSLIELVAVAIGVKPYQVTLTKGHYQTKKTVQVQGLAPHELDEKLAALPEIE